MPHHQIGHRFELSTGETIWTQLSLGNWSAVKCSPVLGEAPEIIDAENEETANEIVADWLEADVLEIM